MSDESWSNTRSVRTTSADSPSTTSSCPLVRIRTLNRDSRCFRFSSYVPNRVSAPCSGRAIFRMTVAGGMEGTPSEGTNSPQPTTHTPLPLRRAAGCQVQLPQLTGVYVRGGSGHQIDCLGRLWKGNHVPDRG